MKSPEGEVSQEPKEKVCPGQSGSDTWPALPWDRRAADRPGTGLGGMETQGPGQQPSQQRQGVEATERRGGGTGAWSPVGGERTGGRSEPGSSGRLGRGGAEGGHETARRPVGFQFLGGRCTSRGSRKCFEGAVV